jgi:hypothetical protein
MRHCCNKMQHETETSGEQATAASSATSTGYGNEGSDTPPESGGQKSRGCEGCGTPAAAKARALRHVWMGAGMVMMLLVTLQVRKTAAARSRAA